MLTNADKKALAKKFNGLMSRYAELDDALYYLQTNPAAVRNKIRNYKADIKAFIMNESGYNDTDLRETLQGKLAEYEKNIEKYAKAGKIDYRRPNFEKLQESVYNQYSDQVDTVTNHIESTLNQRASQFRALANAAEIPLSRAADVANYTIRAVNIGGNQYNAVQLGEYWSRMLDEYGTRGSIMYRNGANYPLTRYIEQRVQTSEAETDRLVSTITSSANGILIGQISQTGTRDSCIFWENKYVFMSEEAREQALAKFPKVKSLRTMKTAQEVKEDKTHMFKWNCKHRILPAPIQFLDEDEFAEELGYDNKPNLPKKIDEKQIYEKITGKKYNPPKGGQVEKMREAAELDIPKARYTIA